MAPRVKRYLRMLRPADRGTIRNTAISPWEMASCLVLPMRQNELRPFKMAEGFLRRSTSQRLPITEDHSHISSRKLMGHFVQLDICWCDLVVNRPNQQHKFKVPLSSLSEHEMKNLLSQRRRSTQGCELRLSRKGSTSSCA